MTSLPSGTSSGLTTARQAMAGQMVHHVLVVDDGTQHHTGSPDWAAPSASSTARRTP